MVFIFTVISPSEAKKFYLEEHILVRCYEHNFEEDHYVMLLFSFPMQSVCGGWMLFDSLKDE